MQQQLLDAGEDGAAPSRSLSLRTRVAATGLVGSAHVMGELHGRQAQEERRHHPSSDRQFGLAEVVLSHHESWQREMPKTGAVSLAQAHALQWGADDLQASERPAGAREAGGEPELPAYLWVVRAPIRRP